MDLGDDPVLLRGSLPRAEFEEQGYDDVEFLFKMSPSNMREMLQHVKMNKHHRAMYHAAHKVWKNSYSVPTSYSHERLPRRSARIAFRFEGAPLVDARDQP